MLEQLMSVISGGTTVLALIGAFIFKVIKPDAKTTRAWIKEKIWEKPSAWYGIAALFFIGTTLIFIDLWVTASINSGAEVEDIPRIKINEPKLFGTIELKSGVTGFNVAGICYGELGDRYMWACIRYDKSTNEYYVEEIAPVKGENVTEWSVNVKLKQDEPAGEFIQVCIFLCDEDDNKEFENYQRSRTAITHFPGGATKYGEIELVVKQDMSQ